MNLPNVDIQKFSIEFESEQIRGSTWMLGAGSPQVLLLHGGGTSSAKGLEPLRTYLAEQGVSTIAFDFVGHGESSGKILGSSLSSRVEQTKTIVRVLELPLESLSIIGFSMGAYIAIRSTFDLGVLRLGLFIPAVYSKRVYTVPFGAEFSDMIREPRSWEDTDAFHLLGHFRGHLLVVYSELDQVVPVEIPQKMISSSRNALSVLSFQAIGASHQLSERYDQIPGLRTKVYEKVLALSKSTHSLIEI